MIRISLLSICLMASAGYAQDNVIQCDYDAKPETEVAFPKLYLKSLQLGQLLCRNAVEVTASDKEKIDQVIAEFTELTKSTFSSAMDFSPFPGAWDIVNTWESELKNGYQDYLNLTDFNFSRLQINRNNYLKFRLNSLNIAKEYELTSERQNACDESLAKDCVATAEAINASIHPFHYIITSNVLQSSGRKLSRLQSDWEKFIDEARYQTPLDVWFTAWWFDDYYNGQDLVGPKNEQLFLLRPMAVFENISGEETNDTNPSLAVEWIGINWWRTGIGFSLTSTYRDNDITESVGHGITVHVLNKFSIGIADRSGDTSVFINLDLLEWFGDKQSKYNEYKKYF